MCAYLGLVRDADLRLCVCSSVFDSMVTAELLGLWRVVWRYVRVCLAPSLPRRPALAWNSISCDVG